MAQRVGLVFALTGLRQFFLGQHEAVEHGLENVDLVLEMPIDRAACYAGRCCDIRQRGAGHAFVVEHTFGCIKDVRPGLFGFLFGASRH